jgi:hypothetical protein
MDNSVQAAAGVHGRLVYELRHGGGAALVAPESGAVLRPSAAIWQSPSRAQVWARCRGLDVAVRAPEASALLGISRRV